MHTSSFILTVAALATSMMRRRSRWRHAGELQRAAHEGTDEMAVDGLLYSDKTPELAKAVVISCTALAAGRTLVKGTTRAHFSRLGVRLWASTPLDPAASVA